MPCNPEDLGKVELFQLFDEDELREFAAVVDTESFAAGETLFKVGELGATLFIVKSGEVELYIKDTAGQRIVLKIATRDDLFGEISMLDNRPRSATAVALMDTEVFVLDRDDLLLLFQKKPDSGLNMLAAICGMLRDADNLLRTRVARNVNEEIEEKLSILQRISDWIVWFSGSMEFLLLHTIWFVIWVSINIFNIGIYQYDPFPFGLLTMIVSLEAIFLSCFVLISQNRQAAKDKIRDDIEYEVNVQAELEVAHLHEKTDHIHEQMLERFLHLENMIKALTKQ
jgi:uncharacterized membrane protein